MPKEDEQRAAAKGNGALVGELRRAANLILEAPEDYDPLLAQVGDASFVLLGEATHGSHEFYRARAEITRRLIAEKGFTAVAVEADWPDAYRVNCYVRGGSDDATAAGAWATSSVSRPGCGAIPTCVTSSPGCTSITSPCRRPPGSASTASTSTAFTARSGR